MKNSILNFNDFRCCRFLTKTTVVFSVMLLAFTAGAYEPAFRMKIYGDDHNVPDFRVYNDSRDPIIKFSLTIGNIDKSFDYGDSAPYPDEGDHDWGDTATYTGNINPGSSFHFELDIDNNSKNNKLDYRKVLFNNGDDKLNSTLTVWVDQDGETVSSSVVLPDDVFKEIYWIYSEARPGNLEVSSLTEVVGDDDSTEYIEICTVKINDIVMSTTVGEQESFTAFKGDKIEISAPQLVYYGADGEYLTDSSDLL